MLVVRPVENKDLDQLYKLSALAKAGLTTLPHDRKVIKGRIRESVRSFKTIPAKPGGEFFLFVLEDIKRHKLVGTTALFSKVGGFEPFYTYRVHTVIKKSKTLKVKKEIQYLKLVVDHNGPSEIGTLFLSPKYRKRGNGRLLSLCRFLFMAQYKQCFEKRVFAEMRGVIDDKNRSPFWEALGQHFFEVEFKKADLMVMKDKTFIADLIPQHPIYIPLLPFSAQKIIGKTHENTVPALHLLKKEGFRYEGEIDIFEAGPLVKATVDKIRSVKQSKEARIIKINKTSLNLKIKKPFIIANVSGFRRFRAVIGEVKGSSKGVALTSDVAKALNVAISDKVRFVSLRPHGK